MRSIPRAAYLCAVCGLAIGAHAQTVYPEVEPNDNKGVAQAMPGLVNLDRITGLTRGQLLSGGGTTSADYFLVSPAPLPLGIYRHQLDLVNTPLNGLVSHIRGLDQTAAGTIVAGGDVLIQSGHIGTSLSSVWYGFGRAEPLYLRMHGTSSSSAYTMAFSTAAAQVTQISQPLAAGDITILVEMGAGNPDAEIWVYDANLNPIPGANNDDPVFPMSPIDAASLTRSYQAGTYYFMVGLANAATHMSSPGDEATPADDDVLDFAGALVTLGGAAVSKFGTISLIDAQGVVQLTQVPIQVNGRWYRFDVVGGCTAAAIAQHPQSVTAAVSQPVTLEVYATGSDPLSYQWRFNGADITGATGTQYAIQSLTLADAGSYTVVVSNPCATVESSAAVVSVVPFEPQITGQPGPQTLCVGSTAAFSVIASPNLGGTLSYQWRKDGAPIAGAMFAAHEFTVASVADGGMYDCVVSESGLGQSTSSAALLTVKNDPPALTLIGSETVQIEVGQQVYQEQGATGTDDCDSSVNVLVGGDVVNSNVPGLYIVYYDATDSQGNQASTLTRYVKVVDTVRPPVAMTMAGKYMWPPYHKLVNVGLTASTSGGGIPSTLKVRVFCDEPEAPPIGWWGNFNFTGCFAPDAKGFAPSKLRLRAERHHLSDGRVYLVMVSAQNASGITGFAFGTVSVPLWWSMQSWISVNTQATTMVNAAKTLAASAQNDQAVANGLKAKGYFEHGKSAPIGPWWWPFQ